MLYYISIRYRGILVKIGIVIIYFLVLIEVYVYLDIKEERCIIKLWGVFYPLFFSFNFHGYEL